MTLLNAAAVAGGQSNAKHRTSVAVCRAVRVLGVRRRIGIPTQAQAVMQVSMWGVSRAVRVMVVCRAVRVVVGRWWVVAILFPSIHIWRNWAVGTPVA